MTRRLPFRYLTLMALGWLTPAVALVRGRVTLDSTPLQGVVVKIETPGRIFLTRTLEDGTFAVADAAGPKVLVSVLQDGTLVYRDYRDPAEEVVISLQSALRLPYTFDPVALAVLPDANVLVSTSDRKLYRFHKGAYQGVVNTPELNDLVGAVRPNASTVFACSSAPTSQLLEYNLSGRLVGSWGIGTPRSNCGSLAFDKNSETLYAINELEMWVYRLHQHSKTPERFADLGNPGRPISEVGPSAVDGEKLYIADPREGKIFAMDLSSKRLMEFSKGLGAVRALAVDSRRNRLYAADSGKHRVWLFDLKTDFPAARDFSGARNVQSAHALDVGEDGIVWVGLRKALLAFSPDGQLKASIN